MRIRLCLTGTTALAAVLAASLAAAGPAGAATGTGIKAAGLALSPATRSQLLSLFAKDRGIPVADVVGIAPDAALQPQVSGGREWTMIGFEPSSHAGVAVKLKFQDGAGTAVFTRTAGHAWTLAGFGGEPAGCAAHIPTTVRRAWHLPGCQAPARSPQPAGSASPATATSGALADIALAQVGVSVNPRSTSFSHDCNPYTTLVGNPDGVGSCGTRTSNGSWFSNEENANEEWCADFTKWVWERAGVTSGLGTLTPSAASFYTWGVDHGEHISFGGTPQVGDAVLFYPAGTSAPNGSYADHVGIVVAVNSGSVNLVDGDFLGSSTISVQYNPDVPGPSWYSSGEEWAFVSPRLSSAPTAYAFWESEAPGDDLMQAQGPADGALSGPANLGMGPLGSAPAVGVDAHGATYVYWKGTDGDLWEAFWNGTKWVGPYNRHMGPLGSPPTVAITANGRAYVFWKSTGPGDDLMEAQGPADGALSGPANLGMGPLGSAPAAGVDATGATYVYWEGTDGDLWEGFWNGSKWVGAFNRGMGPLGSPPTVAVTGNGTAYVFWKSEGPGFDLMQAQGPADGALSGPANLGMGPLGSAPAAGADAAKSTYVYWEGSDGDLWEGFWNGSKWVGAYNRGMGTLGSPPTAALFG
jgi:hypothetical protein